MEYNEFIDWVAPVAQEICKKYALLPSVCIAQGALESAWGNSRIGEYNLFGRKAVNGDRSITVQTQECYDGEWVTIDAAFKDYDSLEEAIEDYCILITEEPVYADCLTYRYDLDPYVRILGSIYATDPEYANKILQTIHANDLEQYDA